MAEIGHCADVCVPRGSPRYGAAAGAVRHACGSGIVYRLTTARWLKLCTQMEITQLHVLTLVHMGAWYLLSLRLDITNLQRSTVPLLVVMRRVSRLCCSTLLPGMAFRH